jgi:hypothetical protein
MKEFWNERYGGTEYVYGTEPNAWFAQQLAQLTPGRILLPAEGEGRNAVHAVRNGWEVTAFDISAAGRTKAMYLAAQHGVRLEYHVGTLAEIPSLPADFDALGLVFAHFPAAIRASLTGDLLTYLRPGGSVIFEAFAKAQLSYQAIHQSGGPQQVDMLYSVDEVRAEFPGIEFLRLDELEVQLHEGPFHHGLARVVRGFGVKR